MENTFSIGYRPTLGLYYDSRYWFQFKKNVSSIISARHSYILKRAIIMDDITLAMV